jgi:hypothetical protein
VAPLKRIWDFIVGLFGLAVIGFAVLSIWPAHHDGFKAWYIMDGEAADYGPFPSRDACIVRRNRIEIRREFHELDHEEQYVSAMNLISPSNP